MSSEPISVGDEVEAREAATVETVESAPSSPKRKKLKSKVWEEFDKVIGPNGEDMAVCMHCMKKLNGASSSGTTHLRNHLLRCPRKSHKDIGQQLLSVTKGKGGSSSTVKPFKFDQERSRLDMARMIIKHGYPFNMVEHEFFEIFINNLQPMFKLVTRNTVKADILQVYKKEKEKLYNIFDKNFSRISLTTDLWTAEHQNLGYACLTAHFIDDEWELRKKIIAYTTVECPHDAETLLRVVKEWILEWNIDKKLFSITVDNASTNDAMVRDLRSWLCKEELLPLNGELFHVRCSAHILNLIVQDGLQEIKGLIKMIRESVKYIRSSPYKKQKFKNAMNQVKLFGKKGVCLDVKTRWNSTYLMLESAIELKEAFHRLEIIDNDFKVNPSKEEWETAKNVCKCLKVFYEASTKFSASSYPTATVYFPEVCEIHLNLISWKDSEHDYLRSMARKMKVKFDKYWEACNILFAIAIILDPQFKYDFVEYNYTEIYGTDADIYLSKVRDVLNNLYSEYASNVSTSWTSPFAPQDSVGSNSLPSVTNTSDRIKRFDTWYLHTRSANIVASQKSELDRYLEENLFPRQPDMNLLSWWHINSPKYPTLSRMARDIFAIPISTVPSESAFSMGGMLIDEARNSLSPDTVEALMLTQDWLDPKNYRDGSSLTRSNI